MTISRDETSLMASPAPLKFILPADNQIYKQQWHVGLRMTKAGSFGRWGELCESLVALTAVPLLFWGNHRWGATTWFRGSIFSFGRHRHTCFHSDWTGSMHSQWKTSFPRTLPAFVVMCFIIILGWILCAYTYICIPPYRKSVVFLSETYDSAILMFTYAQSVVWLLLFSISRPSDRLKQKLSPHLLVIPHSKNSSHPELLRTLTFP